MERTLKNIRRIKGVVTAIFIIIEFSIGIGAISHVMTKGATGIEIGDAVVGLATVLLGHATYMLAFTEREESLVGREHSEAEAEKDRRRLRLKEQIEDLYSPLVAHIDYFPIREEHRQKDTAIWKLMVGLRSKYEFLAEPTLKYELRDYYNPKNTLWLEEKWDLYILPLRDIILDDYESLSQEYEGLTKPVNN